MAIGKTVTYNVTCHICGRKSWDIDDQGDDKQSKLLLPPDWDVFLLPVRTAYSTSHRHVFCLPVATNQYGHLIDVICDTCVVAVKKVITIRRASEATLKVRLRNAKKRVKKFERKEIE